MKQRKSKKYVAKKCKMNKISFKNLKEKRKENGIEIDEKKNDENCGY